MGAYPVSLAELHPAAGDAARAIAALDEASMRCDAALAFGATLGEQLAVLEGALGAPRNLIGATWLVLRLAEPEAAERYREAVRAASDRFEAQIDRLRLCVLRALADASDEEVASLPEPHLAVRARRVRGHVASDAQSGELTRLRLDGLEAPLDAHHATLWGEPYGELELAGERIAVEHRNARALMRDPRAEVRSAAAVVVRDHALRLAAVLEPLKRQRIDCIGALASAAGYGEAFEQTRVESGLTERAIAALLAQREAIVGFTERYFAWKQRRLGLARLTELDLAARACEAGADLSFERLLHGALDTSAAIDPAYPGVLRALVERTCLLTRPGDSRSGDWVCVTNLAGGLPIVHAPSYGDYESYVSIAHELGHACQFTASARRASALALHDAPTWFAEIFSLRFEIDAVHAACEGASDPAERAFWLEAMIDQWLHFVRTLQISARFERELLATSDLSRARSSDVRAQCWRELSPSFLEPAVPGEDARWLLDGYAEIMPCGGFSYGLATVIAYRSKLDGIALSQFADRGAPLAIDEACRRYLTLDIEDPAVFAPVWHHLERRFTELTTLAP